MREACPLTLSRRRGSARARSAARWSRQRPQTGPMPASTRPIPVHGRGVEW